MTRGGVYQSCVEGHQDDPPCGTPATAVIVPLFSFTVGNRKAPQITSCPSTAVPRTKL
jgi:hypothetical protein